MSTWTIVLLAGVATLVIRLVPVALLSTRSTPAWLNRIGPVTAPVALAALGSSLVAGKGSGGPGELLPLLGGVGMAGVVASHTRSTAWAVLAGMLVVWTGTCLVALAS